MNKRFIISCGAAGAGKSTWLNNHYGEPPAKIISRDKIRFSLLKEGDDYFLMEDDVWSEYIAQLQDAINDSSIRTVVADATQLTRNSRKKLIKALNIPENIDIDVLFFDIPVEVCIERNSQRTGRAFVPVDIIRHMNDCKQEPTRSENVRPYTNIIYLNHKQSNAKGGSDFDGIFYV